MWGPRPSLDTGRDFCVRTTAAIADWSTPADWRDWCNREIMLVRLRVGPRLDALTSVTGTAA
jgi:hypothetical protein